jgi:stage III sporulation protein AH
MNAFKRNAVIVTVLLFVGVAVYLNWSYNRGQDQGADYPVAVEQLQTEDAAAREDSQSEEDGETDAEDRNLASLYFNEEATSTLSTTAMSYFDSARLTREQARDSATTLLQEAAAIGTASQEEIDSALAAITTMAGFALQEAQLENILMAKDFEQTVVFIRNEGVSVIVSAPPAGLNEVEVAKITDAVITELSVGADEITIIPVS